MSAVPKFADKKSLKNLVPLNELSATHFEELAKKATVLELKPGKYLFKKGERDTSTCYVLEGEIALVDGSDIKLTIEGGSEEAKHPIAQQQPRQLGARAKTHCTVISIDSGLLDVMLAWEQSTAYEVDDIESDDEDWMTRMMQSDLMQRLPATNLQQLFMRMEEVAVKAGEVVVNQDDEGDFYYIIKQGKCIVSRKPSATGRAVKLAELKDGDSFGEESLLSGAKRNASITMLTAGKLMRLAKKDFNELLKSPLLSQIDFKEAKKMIVEGEAVFLDVRLPGEFTNTHLQGSINIPLAAIRGEIVNIDRNKEYIVYCDTGRRSTSAVFLLGQYGIEAHVLKEGLSNVPIEEHVSDKTKETVNAEIIDINRDKDADQVEQNNTQSKKLDDKEKQRLEKNIVSLQADLEKLQKQLSKTEKNIAGNEKKMEQANALVEEEQEKVRGLEEELLALRDVEIEHDKLKEKLNKAENKLDETIKLLESTRQSDEYAQQKMLSQQQELDKTRKELEALNKSMAESETAGSNKHKELEASNRKLNAISKERDELVIKLDAQDEEKSAIINKLQEKNQALENELQGLQKMLAESQARQGESGQAMESIQKELQAIKAASQALESEKVDLCTQLESLKKNYEQGCVELDEVAQTRRELESELQATKASLESECARSQQSTEELQATVAAHQKESAGLVQKLELSQSEAEQLKADIIQLQQINEKSGSDSAREMGMLQEQARNAEEKSAALQQELAAVQALLTDTEGRLTAVQENAKTIELSAAAKIDELNARFAQVEKQLEEKEGQLEQKYAEYQELEVASKEDKSIAAAEKEKTQKQIDDNLGVIEKLKQDISGVEQQARDNEQQLQAQLQATEQARDTLQQERDGLLAKLVEGDEALAEYKSGSERELQASREKINSFELMIADLEQVNNGLQQTVQDMESRLASDALGLEAAATEKMALEQELKLSKDELDNMRNVLSNANLNKDDLESHYQQQYEQFKSDREALEQQLQISQNKAEELARLNKTLEESQVESRKVIEEFSAVNAELEKLKSELLSVEQDREKEIGDYQVQLDTLKGEHDSLVQELAQSQEKQADLTSQNDRLLSASEDSSAQLEINGLKAALEEARVTAQENVEALAEKSREDENIKNEMISLRAVYAQKEADVSRLEQELALAREVNDRLQHDGEGAEALQALEAELSLVRDRYEQAERENSDKIAGYEESIKEKQQLIETYMNQVDEAVTLKADAESAFKVVESEVDKLRQEHEAYQINIAESHKKISALQFELEAVSSELSNNDHEEEKEKLLKEAAVARDKVAELENSLQDSRKEIKQIREEYELKIQGLQARQEQAGKDSRLQEQMEQLKLEMKTQMDVYKAEASTNASKLSQENEKLLQQIKDLQQASDNTLQAPSAEIHPDHSALFDLPDIDKNLFDNKVSPAKSGGSLIVSIIITVIFSLISAAAVYWYFVLNGKQDLLNTDSRSEVRKSPLESGDKASSIVNSKSTAKAAGTSSKQLAASHSKTGKLKPSRIFSDFLSDGNKGPVMIGVPSGIFSMGSPSNSTYFDERPQHTVSLRKFSISKYEVSFADYDRFAEATGRTKPDDGGWGRDNRPVINVSWDDAVAYTEWLSSQTGHQYRLPSEAEWEYAARAGTQGKYWWGETLAHDQANCFNCGSQWDRMSSAPVGSFSASSLGLHDVSGNVMEWVSDCYHANYDGAPIDGTAWQTAACKSRVVRGGSYRSTAENIRVTKRSEFPHDTALDQIGFRIVRVR